MLKTAALKQPGNACEPFRRVKCPKSRVIHGLVSKQQSRGGRAGAGSRASATTAGRRAPQDEEGCGRAGWAVSPSSRQQRAPVRRTGLAQGRPGTGVRLPEPTWVEAAEKDSEPAQEEAVITRRPKIRGVQGAPVHGNIHPDTHRARKPRIHTPPHSCPNAMYAALGIHYLKKLKSLMTGQEVTSLQLQKERERSGHDWYTGGRLLRHPYQWDPDTELHCLEAPTLRGESMKPLKTDPSINKSIQHLPWREPPSLQPPSNSIYDCSHSLTSQQPEINSGLSNPNLSSSSPSPKLAKLQGPVSREAQPRDPAPARSRCWNIPLNTQRPTLYHGTRNTLVNFIIH